MLLLNGEKGSIPGPEQVEEVAGKVIDRAHRESGSAPEDVNVFRHMASFVVRAKPAFLRSLVAQPEIASVVANRKQEPLEPLAADRPEGAGPSPRP